MTPNPSLIDEPGPLTYDPATGTYRGQCDWERTDPLWLTVVETVSTIAGQEPDAIEPLYSVLDPDALEALLSSSRDDSIQLSFSYEGCKVTLASSGEVTVAPET